jgi:hypothetical protein
MYDIYDWRGFVVRTHSAATFWTVAKRILRGTFGYVYIHKDGAAFGSAYTLEELYDLVNA